MQQLSNKITGNNLTAAEFIQPMGELEHLIQSAGFTLSSGDVKQVGKAFLRAKSHDCAGDGVTDDHGALQALLDWLYSKGGGYVLLDYATYRVLDTLVINDGCGILGYNTLASVIKNDTNAPFDHEVYLDLLAERGYRNYYYGKWHAGPGTAYDPERTSCWLPARPFWRPFSLLLRVHTMRSMRLPNRCTVLLIGYESSLPPFFHPLYPNC